MASGQQIERGATPRAGGLAPFFREAAPLLLVGLVGSILRLYDLNIIPPGFHHDEAVNGLDIIVTIPQSHPIFFELNNGREPLFIYLQWLMVQAIGPTVLALRLTAALVGILTVLGTYWLAREWFDRRVALLAGMGLAVSFWHVDLSRVGLRAISLPLFLVFGLALLSRGLRRGEKLSYALGGLALGLSFYTYLSSRLVPFLLVGFAIWGVLRGAKALRRQWTGLLLFCLVGLATVAPLGLYFAEHPGDFLGRSGQVSIFNPNPSIEGKLSTPRENVERTFGMFFFEGDVNPRHNLPGQPVFDLVAAPWFALGLAVAVWRSVRALASRRRASDRSDPTVPSPKETTGYSPWHECQRYGRGLKPQPDGDSSPLSDHTPAVSGRAPRPLRATNDEDAASGSPFPDGEGGQGVRSVPAPDLHSSDRSRDRSAWLLIWLGGFLALGAVTQESPNYLRLTGMAPAVYVLWALGVGEAWRWLGLRLRRVVKPAALLAPALVVALLGFEGYRTSVGYFGEWARRPDVAEAFDAGLDQAARYVESTATAGTAAFAYVDRSPSVLFLSPKSRAGRWLQQGSSLLLLPNGEPTDSLYLLGGESAAKAAPLYFGGLRPDLLQPDSKGAAFLAGYHLSADQVRALATPETPVGREFGGPEDRVELVGYTLDRTTARPGEKVALTLLWRQKGDAEVIQAPYLHVQDATGRSWGQDDRLGFVVGGWREGDLFLSRHEWVVPPDAPPIGYHLSVGMATRGKVWPPGDVQSLGSPVDLATVSVVEPGRVPADGSLPQIKTRLDADVGAGLKLLGVDAPGGTVKSGDTLSVDLLWGATEAPGRDVLAELSLVDGSGRASGASAARPAYGEYPTSRWPSGALLRDPRKLTVPGDAPSGKLRLRLRTLDAATGEALGEATLGEVEVSQPPRDFTLPTIQKPLNADFGGEVALRGYAVDQEKLTPSGTLKLTLYWQAERAPTKNYTVFAHLLDSANKVVAQQDSPPARGVSPTLGWAPGQVVVDEYELKLPAEVSSGGLALEVGLYDPATGERLKLADAKADHLILAKLPVGQ